MLRFQQWPTSPGHIRTSANNRPSTDEVFAAGKHRRERQEVRRLWHCHVFAAMLLFVGASQTLTAQSKTLAPQDQPSRPGTKPEGKLLFADDFERNESQEVTDELGLGWSTNSKRRAGGHKQVDLGDGTLHIFRHETADHSVSVVHPAEFTDCRVELRFRLDDPGDDLGIDFADMQCQDVHAGHICKVFFRPDGIEILDYKMGRMNKQYRDALKAGQLTETQKANVKRYQRQVAKQIKLKQWYSAVVTILGDTLSVTLDGQPVGAFSSPGIEHSQKDMIRFSARHQVRLDDVRVFALFRAAASTESGQPPAKHLVVNHLFVAKLLWQRMQSVDLTDQQVAAFNQLSSNLRSRVDKLRAEAGITKDTIKRRDEIYSELKKTSLQGDDLWNELQRRGSFTDLQRDTFRKTHQHNAAFKSAALDLLTPEQRKRLPKPGRRDRSK